MTSFSSPQFVNLGAGLEKVPVITSGYFSSLGCHTVTLSNLSCILPGVAVPETHKRAIKEVYGIDPRQYTDPFVECLYSNLEKKCRKDPGFIRLWETLRTNVFNFWRMNYLFDKVQIIMSDRVTRQKETELTDGFQVMVDGCPRIKQLTTGDFAKWLIETQGMACIASPLMLNQNYQYSDNPHVCQTWMLINQSQDGQVAWDTGYLANSKGTTLADMRKFLDRKAKHADAVLLGVDTDIGDCVRSGKYIPLSNTATTAKEAA